MRTETNMALEASAHSTALECYDVQNFCTAVTDTEEGSLMYFPAGRHTITPSQGGRPVTVTVEIDADSADAIEQERQALIARNKSPYFSIEHENDVAAFRPTRFYFATKPDAAGRQATGVWADGEWTGAGKNAVKSKNYKFFSPTFHIDSVLADPARVVCEPMAKAVLGSLVNEPAFTAISPLFAKDASGDIIEAGGRGSGRVDYSTARDAATCADLKSDLATQRALLKGSPASNRAAADAHKDAVTRHAAAEKLGISDGTKLWHKKMIDLHSGMGDFHESCADCSPASVIPPQPDEKAAPNAASDASGEHEFLMAVQPFAAAYNEALEASAKTNAADGAVRDFRQLSTLSDDEAAAWKNIADWAERNGYHGAGSNYRESEKLAENFSGVCKKLARQ